MVESRTKPKLTPADHGRRMSLADFENAQVQEGYRYELSRGVIVVCEIPNPCEGIILDAVRQQFAIYRPTQPGVIKMIASAAGCKILLQQLESERHPDMALYLTQPPSNDSTAWRSWIPEIVVEVVSPDSFERDYKEKREEYLQFGVREY